MSMEALKPFNFPPFCREIDWIVDPLKVVTRPVKIMLETIPEEEEEAPKEIIKIVPKRTEKTVRFATYADVHMRCPIIDSRIRYPSKMIEELKQENALLNDDLLIAEKKIEQLELKLRRTHQALSRTYTINDMLPLWILLFILIGSIIAFKYTQLNL